MLRSNARLMAVLAALSFIMTSSAAFAAPSIFEQLMPGQKPLDEITLPDPPQYIKSMLPMMSVQKVELKTFGIKQGVSDADLLKNIKSGARTAGWMERIVSNPGKGFDAVFSHGTASSMELMLVEIKDGDRKVSLTRVSGTTPDTDRPEVVTKPIVRKEAPRSVNELRIAALGPELQYEAWAADLVEVEKRQGSGDFAMPDIVSVGSAMKVDLLTTQRSQSFGMAPGLDYIVRGPQRMMVFIDSTGSPVTVKLNGIKGLDVKAANAQVIITGKLSTGELSVEAVNRKVVLNLESVTGGKIKVTGTNAEITVTMPKNADVTVNANAVAGSVTVNGAASLPVIDNPYKQTFGSGSAQMDLEAISNRVTVTLK